MFEGRRLGCRTVKHKETHHYQASMHAAARRKRPRGGRGNAWCRQAIMRGVKAIDEGCCWG